MRTRALPFAAALVALLCVSCGGQAAPFCGGGGGTMVRFDPDLPGTGSAAEAWLAYPFPADHRRTSRGTIDLTDFPNPGATGLVRDYAALGTSELHGFSENGAVYMAFTAPLDPKTIPVFDGTFMSTSAPIQLIDITKSSPEYGMRRPLRIAYRDVADGFLPASTLAIAPQWGFPLRPKTTYALIVTNAVKDAKGKPLATPPLLAWLLGRDARCQSQVPKTGKLSTLEQEFDPLRTRLTADHIDASTIAAATVFTTSDSVGELAAFHDQIENDLPAPAGDGAWKAIGPNGGWWLTKSYKWNSTDTVTYYVMQGSYVAPNYMEGTVPYAASGGALHEVDGKPTAVRQETMRFVLSIPTAPPADGGACYPIVEYAHGTGGSAYTVVNSASAARFAARGLASISIDQPIEGDRAEGKTFDVDLMTFNLANGDSARSLLRQSAIDTFSLTRFVRESLGVPPGKSPTGGAICFDPNRVLFFGHSQGGLSGSIAAAYETHIQAWVISGSGGGLSRTLMQRKYPYDLAALVTALGGIGPNDQPLTELHPLMTLAQTLVDITDPINYSPYWDAWDGHSPPQSIFMTSGQQDQDTPYLTATAEGVAARIPAVEPVVIPIPQDKLLGLDPVTPPVSADVDGQTCGFLQWQGQDHFVVFDLPEAIDSSMHFLKTAAYDGAPVIERNPTTDAR